MLLQISLTSVLIPAVVIFFVVMIVLVVLLLITKAKLLPSGTVKLTINNDKVLEVEQGGSVMSTLGSNGIFLPSACGGKGACGQCKLRVPEGGGDILPTEKGFFSRK